MIRFTTKIHTSTTNKVIQGVNKAADIIISTMGGAGKNVIINGINANFRLEEVGPNTLTFTKDGVSVAKNIKFTDPEENIGATLLINAANRTVEQCGDGTTTTVLFVKTLVNELVKFLDTNKTSMDNVLNELDTFVELFTAVITKKAKQVETIEDIYRVARTSSKSASIANLMSEIYTQTGFGASISLENSRTSDTTYYQIINGLEFPKPMVNSRFANQENGSAVLENCKILLDSNVANDFDGLAKLLDEHLGEQVPILIIAPQFSTAFVNSCLSALRQGLKICLVESPGHGSNIIENYLDIMAFSNNGFIDKVVVTPYNFTLFNTPDKVTLDNRVKKLKTLAESAVEDYDEQNYNNRINRLNQSGAIIYVGGTTEKNAKEEYDRIEDCIGAVSSAIKGGYVRGAGSELAMLNNYFSDLTISKQINNTLFSQVKQIMNNANLSTRTIKYDVPFNVRSKQYDETIIDPANVLIAAMSNAVALTKLLLNTSYILHNE